VSAPLSLPPRIDLSCIGGLASDFRQAPDGPLVVDAGAVTVLGGLGVQVLLAAAYERRALGHEFRVTRASEAFTQALRQFGIRAEDLGAGGTA
jgi:chemotaxis protein CheX